MCEDDVSTGQALRHLALTSADLAKSIVDLVPETSRFVLLGASTCGTLEHFELRSAITKLLIKQRGFHALLLESDSQPAWRINRFSSALPCQDHTALAALGAYKRGPRWIWRNRSMADFLTWLREHNSQQAAARPPRPHVTVHGLDVFSLHESAEAVVSYLQRHDKEAARRAKARYHCLDKYGNSEVDYAMAVGVTKQPSCESTVVAELAQVRKRAAEIAASKADEALSQEEALQAEADALTVKDAEVYYRNLFLGDAVPYNVRERHFLEVTKLVERHLQRKVAAQPRLIIWAHNSHAGDARASEAEWRRGELSLGQLLREDAADATFCVGFATYSGTFTAASEWDEVEGHPVPLPSAPPGSLESSLHATGLSQFALDLRDKAVKRALKGTLLQRGMGAVYRPQHDQRTHYLEANVADEFDVLVFVDQSTALNTLG